MTLGDKLAAVAGKVGRPALDRRRGWPTLPCLLCGAAGGLKLRLDGVRAFECDECSEAFTADLAAAVIDRWIEVLDWCSKAPVATDAAGRERDVP